MTTGSLKLSAGRTAREGGGARDAACRIEGGQDVRGLPRGLTFRLRHLLDIDTGSNEGCCLGIVGQVLDVALADRKIEAGKLQVSVLVIFIQQPPRGWDNRRHSRAGAYAGTMRGGTLPERCKQHVQVGRYKLAFLLSLLGYFHPPCGIRRA